MNRICIASLVALTGALAGCGHNLSVELAQPLDCAAAAARIAANNPVSGTTLRITTAAAQPANQTMAPHCLIEGAMNERTSAVDGRPYAIKFRMRLPDLWNEKLYMAGGGGSNGTLGDASGPITGYASALTRGYAVIVTDSGHDNAVNTDPARGGGSAFGIDPQARVDFGYHSYDVVTQLGKALVRSFYAKQPKHAYFAGCSEGGREAMMMVQRFPAHYDGVIAGCPAMSTPVVAAYPSLLAQSFAPLAIQGGFYDPNLATRPLVNKVFTDADWQLFADAILKACDALDGLVDGMVNHFSACTDAVVVPQFEAITCAGAKTITCVTAVQVSALRATFAGPKTSTGVQLYPGLPWDPGIGGMNGATFNQGFRSWWMGSYNSATNDSILMTLRAPQTSMVYTTPPTPITVAQNFDRELAYNRDELMANITRTTSVYTQSSADFGLASSTDLSGFKQHHGKLIMYGGRADPAVSSYETTAYYDKVNQAQHGTAAQFVRLFLVPGMNHGAGGPSTDRFDALAALEAWVERGVAPDSIPASAASPGYFGVASRTRPLCAYPHWAHYKGAGDINDAGSFACLP